MGLHAKSDNTCSIKIMTQTEIEINNVLLALGEPKSWEIPEGYPNSLGLCVIDSLWSIGINYKTVENVLGKYLLARGFKDKSLCTDGPTEVLDWINTQVVDSDYLPVAIKLGSKNRTSSKSGILKAEVVADACRLLIENKINDCSQFIIADDEMKSLWKQLVGQSSGVSFRYLLMLAGKPGYKPDRMIRKFVKRYAPSFNENVEGLFTEVENRLRGQLPSIDWTIIDHRMWESGREL